MALDNLTTIDPALREQVGEELYSIGKALAMLREQLELPETVAAAAYWLSKAAAEVAAEAAAFEAAINLRGDAANADALEAALGQYDIAASLLESVRCLFGIETAEEAAFELSNLLEKPA